jgi:hypothetical protein
VQRCDFATPGPKTIEVIMSMAEKNGSASVSIGVLAACGVLLAACSSTGGAQDARVADAGATTTPIHFGVMTHLEAGQQFPNQQVFTGYDTDIRTLVNLFVANNAKITIESEKSYIRAATQWAATDNGLLYALSKGVGVGTHCDEIADATVQADFETNKASVDSIVGAANNVGCSGGWVKTDWAVAAANAGFKYLDGVVFFAYMAVPVQNRPVNPNTGSPYTDQEIKSTYYHDPAPPDLMDRIYPRLLSSTTDLNADADGKLLLMTGELGEIASLSEGRSNCFPNCSLTQADFDVITTTIETAFAAKDHRKFAMLYLHFPMETLRAAPDGSATTAQKTALATTWLKKMAELRAQGKIVWVTQKEAYEQFSAWGK